ncbi:MAG TPA: hypothetical protein DDZ51_28630 [Planctomycetaceae bacterium]|nr:hypothetical protein [Planctomycetaceae bacterium]
MNNTKLRKGLSSGFRLSLLFCLTIVVFAGCSSGDGKIPVSGIVKLGDAPLAGATVGFIGNDGGQIAHSLTDATGRFTIRATPGINKVIVNKSPDANQVAAEVDSAVSAVAVVEDESVNMLAGAEIGTQAAAAPKRQWIVDQKFASPQTSELEFDVKEGMAEIELIVTAP